MVHLFDPMRYGCCSQCRAFNLRYFFKLFKIYAGIYLAYHNVVALILMGM